MTLSHYIIAQINQVVGDIEGNLQRIIEAAKPHRITPDTIVVFPELSLIGYPPEDLVLRPAFIEKNMAAIQALMELTATELPAIIVGGLWQQDGLLFNAALLLADGKILHIHRKSMLPNYGIFDEKRYFAHGSAPVVAAFRGHKMGMLVCEDAWYGHNSRLLAAQGAQSIVIINASPFERGKFEKRQEIIKRIASTHHMQVVYVNLVGGQDDIVFDGASFICSATGQIIFQAPAFKESVNTPGEVSIHAEQIVWQALALGLKDYIHKNHFKKVLLGLSGGIDSALVATLATDALGKENVLGCLLPSEFTSDASNKDAEACARLLGIQTVSIPITYSIDAMEHALIPTLNTLGVATRDWRKNLTIGGNIQSRLRGMTLMTMSNALGALLLNTSNKSEIAVGYSTLYGDACGAYSPLKDIYKTYVYKLATWRNQQGKVIPDAIISKTPTAELAPGQKDSDQLPEYEVLDVILEKFIDQRESVTQLISQGFDKMTVEKIYQMLKTAEYKRRQFPPGTKISSMHFGRDWRYPLTNGFKG